MNWTLSDRWIEKLLLLVGGLSLLTLLWSGLGFGLGLGSILTFGFFCYLLTALGRMHTQLDQEGFEDSSWAQISFWFFLFFSGLNILFYYTESSGFLFIKNLNLNGDWPYHLNQIYYLAKTSLVWPENPILAAEPMRYAFGINWFTAVLLQTGLPLQFLILSSASLSVLMTASLLKRSFGAWGLWAFFASGGGWALSLAQVKNAWDPSSQLAWKNLFLAVYMPQRGFWFALPCGLYLMRFLMAHWQEKRSLSFPASFIFLWSILPFFHLHTFVIISILILVTALHQRQWLRLLKFFPAAPLALFFIFKSVSQENVGGSLRWGSGWMTGSLGIVNSLIVNYGPWLLLLVLFGIYIFSRAGQRFIFGAVLALAVFFNFAILAPWDWDQIKIVLWLYLALSYFMARECRTQTSPLVGVGLMILVHAVGFFQFIGGNSGRLPPMNLWSISDQNSVRALLSEVPVEARILIASEPHHPVWSSGRAVVAGYEGHIWAHGVNTEGLKESILALFHGQQIQSLRFSKMTANYLLWGPLEKTWFGLEVPSETVWIKSKSVGDYSLYSRSKVSAPTDN